MLSSTVGFARHQRGAVAIIVALSIAVLIGMIGLAVDLGRMFVIKTELQNAADACALAAARELDGISGAKQRADAAGALVGTRNEINFQGESAPITEASLSYSDSLSPNSAYNRSISDADAKFAMCTASRPDIGMLFMGVLGFGDQTVNAYAVATLAPGQTTCAIPIGICTPTGVPGTPPAPKWGLEVGQWYGGKFNTTQSTCQTGTTTGNFNWIDFSPPNGGANELKDILEGVGQCQLPDVGTPVGQTGMNNGLRAAWNSRFGVYGLGLNIGHATNIPPDFTGIAYTNANFPSGFSTETWPTATPGTKPNAFNGSPATGSTHNYETASANREPYQSGNPSNANGTALPSTGSPSHTENGQQRRIAIAPIVDCQSLCASSSTTVPILDYACVMMLSPLPNNPNNIWIEYRGLATDPNSPCGTFGLGGGSGPLVPVLVQ